MRTISKHLILEHALPTYRDDDGGAIEDRIVEVVYLNENEAILLVYPDISNRREAVGVPTTPRRG